MTIEGRVDLACDFNYTWAAVQACLVISGDVITGCIINSNTNEDSVSAIAKTGCGPGPWVTRGLIMGGVSVVPGPPIYTQSPSREIGCPVYVELFPKQ